MATLFFYGGMGAPSLLVDIITETMVEEHYKSRSNRRAIESTITESDPVFQFVRGSEVRLTQ